MRSPMFYKPNILRRVLTILGILLGVLVIIGLAVTLAMHYNNKEKNVPVNNQPTITALSFELDPGISYKSAVTDTALFFYSSENMKVVNPKGEAVEDISLKFSHPAVSTKGSVALFFDRGGHKAALFNGIRLSKSLELQEKILLANANANGYSVIVTESDLHKCAVRVFAPDGKEKFVWNSGGLTVVAADIADNNKDITVSAVNTDEGAVKNHIIMFNIAKEKPFTNDLYDGELISLIRYSGSYLYCIGTANTYIYNGYGKCVGTAAYNDRELQRYALDNELLLLVFSGSSDTSGVAEIKSYNHKGETTGSFSAVQNFDFLDVKDGTVVLNNGRTISLLNSRCQEKRQINLNFDLRNFMFFGNNSRGIGITAVGAEMIQLN